MVSAYVPDTGIQEHLKEHRDMQVWKLRYVPQVYFTNGSQMKTEHLP